jgi:hypothetical protein
MYPIKERRLKKYYIDPDCLLNYLQAMKHWPACFGRAIIEDLPEDAKLLDVNYDHDRRCLRALVFHESFPEVPDGEMIPEGSGGYFRIRFGWFVRQSDGSYRSTDDRQEAFSSLTSMHVEKISPTKYGFEVVRGNVKEKFTVNDWAVEISTEVFPATNGDGEPVYLKAGDKIETPQGPATVLPAEVVNSEDGKTYNEVEQQAEFFRQSILNG